MERFEELEFEGCKKNRKSLDFERSTIVDYILEIGDPKIQKFKKGSKELDLQRCGKF